MTRLFFLTCFIFFITGLFGQKDDTLLYRAYKSKSLTELQLFFENWALETPSVSNEELERLNDTSKNVYMIFQCFYNPRDIDRIGGSEFGNDIYKNVKYFLIQNKVNYGVVDTLVIDTNDLREIKFSKASKYDTLKNFRPQLSFLNEKCLTLTRYYADLLNRFLGNKHYKLGTGSIMSPARSKGESARRMGFLEKLIRIWYGHWGGYWQLHTYPYVSRITFDKKFQNAVIDFVMVYEGGYAYFKKINNRWILTKAERTWIE